MSLSPLDGERCASRAERDLVEGRWQGSMQERVSESGLFASDPTGLRRLSSLKTRLGSNSE